MFSKIFFIDSDSGNGGSNLGNVMLISTPNISGYDFDKHGKEYQTFSINLIMLIFTDIDELLSLVSEMPNQMHRPKKIRAIFASKACRKSVMFGEAIPEQKMQEIIMNMGRIDQPWNCPHGRPTIRHICTIYIP